uniref:Uncharacterized protein n=1 Tax=Oryza rufipogon TaxID=4529 RepID=A0A0E0Q458_ORYRU
MAAVDDDAYSSASWCRGGGGRRRQPPLLSCWCPLLMIAELLSIGSALLVAMVISDVDGGIGGRTARQSFHPKDY